MRLCADVNGLVNQVRCTVGQLTWDGTNTTRMWMHNNKHTGRTVQSVTHCSSSLYCIQATTAHLYVRQSHLAVGCSLQLYGRPCCGGRAGEIRWCEEACVFCLWRRWRTTNMMESNRACFLVPFVVFPVFTRSNAFRQFTVYVRINIISELFRPVEKKQTV